METNFFLPPQVLGLNVSDAFILPSGPVLRKVKGEFNKDILREHGPSITYLCESLLDHDKGPAHMKIHTALRKTNRTVGTFISLLQSANFDMFLTLLRQNHNFQQAYFALFVFPLHYTLACLDWKGACGL